MAVTVTTDGSGSPYGSGRLLRRLLFTGSGTSTYTLGDDVMYVIAKTLGAGAGGGGTDATANSLAVGGGGGAYSEAWIPRSSISGTETVTVGAGGAGGANTGANGTVGGDSSFGSLCSAKGGAVGTGSTSSAVKAGVAGGAASSGVGDLAIDGGLSDGVFATLISIGRAGDGAGPYGGFGAPYPTAQGAGTAAIATNYGAGGGPAFSVAGAAAAGGAGANGLVILEEYGELRP